MSNVSPTKIEENYFLKEKDLLENHLLEEVIFKFEKENKQLIEIEKLLDKVCSENPIDPKKSI